MELAYQTDTTLADLYGQREQASERNARHFESMHYHVNDRKGYRGRQYTWNMSPAEVLDAARTFLAIPESELPAWRREDHRHIGKDLDGVETERQVIERLDHEIAELQKVYAADPWPRYFPCQTHNEHIHSGYGCAGLKHNSVLLWQPDLSGHTIEEAVAKLGPRLCTHCYPNAPVEYTQGEPDTSCPGSGKYIQFPAGTPLHRQRYGACPEEGCRYSGRLTQYGYVRKHAKKES